MVEVTQEDCDAAMRAVYGNLFAEGVTLGVPAVVPFREAIKSAKIARIAALTAAHAEAAELRAEVERLREAGSRLVANVLARHPGEKLRCPDMIALAVALEKTT